MSVGPFEPYAEDLAPGDRGVLDSDWSSFAIERVDSPSHPSFDEAYARLWQEFGARGEMERREVIADRLGWRGEPRADGYALSYQMIVVRRLGEMVAVRDHSVIVPAPAGAETVVHLSHVLVEPAMRGRGLAAWLRALPVAAAAAAKHGGGRSITLVAEMEHGDDRDGGIRRRFRSYARAGFRMVDPLSVAYSQPDFRDDAEIDRTGPRPVPLCLVIRRVGREHENTIAAAALREIVDAAYAMFAAHIRADRMAEVRSALRIPPGGGEVALVVPGFAPPEDRTVIK